MNSVRASRKTTIKLPHERVEDQETEAEYEVGPDACPVCESGNSLVLEMDGDADPRIRCTTCGRATSYAEDERDCGDCSDCGEHEHEECSDHGRTLTCPGCSCVDDDSDCTCSCCLSSSKFQIVVGYWNDGECLTSEGDLDKKPKKEKKEEPDGYDGNCIRCGELEGRDCKCRCPVHPNFFVDDCACNFCAVCRRNYCSCDPNECDCDMHSKSRDQLNGGTVTMILLNKEAVDDEWENA